MLARDSQGRASANEVSETDARPDRRRPNFRAPRQVKLLNETTSTVEREATRGQAEGCERQTRFSAPNQARTDRGRNRRAER